MSSIAMGRTGLAVVLALAVSSPAHSAGPYVVDDAGITPAGRWQLETWALVGRGGDRVLVVNPAFALGVLPGVEWSLTYENAAEERVGADSLGLEAKWMLRDPRSAALGLALAVGVGRDLRAGETDSLSLTGVATWTMRPDLLVHTNAGAARRPNASRGERTQALGGVGVEWEAGEGFFALGELFARTGEPAGLQLGVRPTLGATGLDLDLAFARNLTGRRASWFTLGLARVF